MPDQSQVEGWRVVGVKPGEGEQCIVCDLPIQGANAVQILHRGRVVHVNEMMMPKWRQDAGRYFRKVQARAALFDEESLALRGLELGWLLFGVYVLVGLVAGGGCAYIAVARGLAPIPWFFAGLVGNVAALAVLCTRPAADTSALPQGVPHGLVKVPTTHAPITCPACGRPNHPSTALCSGCGAVLSPSVEAEAART
jgi:hypothetical protein